MIRRPPRSTQSRSSAASDVYKQSHHVMYGMGVFPVIRVELTDASALREAIQRVEAKMGISMPRNDFNGKTYWRISDDDNQKVGIYVAILDQQLAISVFPT